MPRLSNPFEQDGGEVVGLGGVGKIPQGLSNALKDIDGGPAVVLKEHVGDAVGAEHGAIGFSPFEKAVGQEGENIAFLEGDVLDGGIEDIFHDSHGDAVGAEGVGDSGVGVMPEERSLPGAEILQQTGISVKQSEKCGYEPVAGEVGFKEFVCVGDDGIEVVVHVEHGAEHGAGGHGDQGGTDAMAGDIAEDEDEAIFVEGDEVAEIASDFIAGSVPDGDLEAFEMRGGFWEKVLLDFGGDFEGLFHFLFEEEFFDEMGSLEGDAGLGGKGGGEVFVLLIECAGFFVEDLKDSDECAVKIHQRGREDVPSAIAGFFIDFAVEAGIGVGVGDVDDLQGHGGRSGQALVGGEPQFPRSFGDAGEEFMAGFVVEENGGPFGVEELHGGIDDHLKEGVEIGGNSHRSGDIKQGMT